MKRRHIHLLFAAASLVLALLFCSPYLIRDLLPVEHDTFFHLSRIEGLARALSEGQLLPALYPYKNNGFGYASPLFYCDLLLLPAALLLNAGIPLSVCCKITILTETALAAYAVMCCIYRISRSRFQALLAAGAYTFANYHITDVYVRGALGEVQAMIFLPVLLEGIYLLLYEQKETEWPLCAAALCGLALTHNLTFLLAVILSLLFFLLRLGAFPRRILAAVMKTVLAAFLMSAFFTLPMLEQMFSNRFYLNYYGTSSDLAAGSLPLWKYFANTTVFGYSDNALPQDQQMLVNPGWFLTAVPLLYLFCRNKDRFIKHCLILGYIFLVLPASFIPWDALFFLRILQFPWRLLQLSMLLLTVPAAAGFAGFIRNRVLQTCALLLISAEGLWHVMPVTERTFGMTSDMTWQDVTEGALCDPNYSATYMRVELAGGDYLPLSSPDYRTLQPELMDSSLHPLGVPSEKSGTTLTFTLSEEDTGQEIVLPLTWYLGYRIYRIEDGTESPVSSGKNGYGLVSFVPSEAGTYVCRYESTPLRNACIAVSAVSAAEFLVLVCRKRRHAS